MASPPYNQNYGSALSPPYPSHSQLPQPPLKRRHTDMPSSVPSIKRRKASVLSTTSAPLTHPLRQTSFPPENAMTPTYSRSPSMDNASIAGSVAGTKRKRSRKSKGKDIDDAASTADGRAQSSAPGNPKGREGTREATEEAEDDDGDIPGMNLSEEVQAERDRQAILASAFDPDQETRFGIWRASKLSDAIVRKIVNQTLSQSVPAGVVLAVRSAAKIYAGTLIENARKVQTQWLEAGVDPNPPPEGFPVPDGEKEARRGPLLPEHLREAYRRHMLGDEALVGQMGLWQAQNSSGIERHAVRVRGKRLFK